MAIFDLEDLTMNPEEATQISQAVFERSIISGDLSKYHEIVPGIQRDTQIPFIGNFGLIGSKVESCDRDIDGSKLKLTEKFWTPKPIGGRLKHCALDVNPLFKLFEKARRMNPDFYDRIGSQELGIILTKLEDALNRMTHRLVWFGDTAAANVTGGGVITDGTDVKYFNAFDGLFKQIFAEIPTTASNYVEIPGNDTGAALAADAALSLFRNMHNSLDARFFAAIGEGAQPQFLVTRELMQNYWDTLEDKSISFSIQETQEGINRMAYRGIPIEVRHDWDAVIGAYQEGAAGALNLPNRAILTVKENIPVGTLSTEDLDTIVSWYEKKDHANYMDFDLMLDAKHLEPYMTVAAY